jgi:uncharacterized membrane-anchored protein
MQSLADFLKTEATERCRIHSSFEMNRTGGHGSANVEGHRGSRCPLIEKGFTRIRTIQQGPAVVASDGMSMSSEVHIGDGSEVRLTPHRLRAAILGELHARPFTPLPVPSRIVHFGFDTSGARAQADRANLVEFCASRGLTPPAASEKHHRAPFGTTILRWEQHSEFTIYTWEMPADPGGAPFHPDAASLAAQMRLVPQPGPLLVAIDLHLLAEDGPRTAPERLFDRASLAVAKNSDGTATYATDFQPGPSGFVRILVADRGMDAERTGAGSVVTRTT